eukprot:gnl/TRDRNA2_/TRDRNA2_142835_c0_seq2.p1 gnl/TRDRNA2_/TRDRNA2_142835_c0~~gnl/TRDRNA2_/TRDRNA2_142835_c0_seq2.p1  ORF type:complete len:112 (-),score=10.96 gnl/TRDRNA2_/TRDRNA2_142835_c0_seq2:547-882(-)
MRLCPQVIPAASRMAATCCSLTSLFCHLRPSTRLEDVARSRRAEKMTTRKAPYCSCAYSHARRSTGHVCRGALQTQRRNCHLQVKLWDAKEVNLMDEMNNGRSSHESGKKP